MNGRTDRALGAFLGLAVGEAVGTTLGFAERDRQPRLTDMVGGGPFGLPPGGWTDDTSMALALADSLAERGRLDPDDVMRRWVRWWREGAYSHTGRYFDIGIQTHSALAAYERTGRLPAPTDSAGNGAIMRLAPVVLFAPDAGAEEAARLSAAQARLTHNTDEAADTAAAMARLLHGLIEGGGREAVGHIAARREEVRASGWVRHTWHAARWAVATTTSFEEAVLAAANLAEDADTTAAVAGQIAGALYGLSGIPPRWLDRLLWRAEIDALARRLLPAEA
ncbi:MAG: ADP-ribosylglycohydrolase family protein [Acetobacteraceae bacterium]|nr:ADP-ribosylglycohydrolase family protein [Acetobacteraceae bacterium]